MAENGRRGYGEENAPIAQKHNNKQSRKKKPTGNHNRWEEQSMECLGRGRVACGKMVNLMEGKVMQGGCTGTNVVDQDLPLGNNAVLLGGF